MNTDEKKASGAETLQDAERRKFLNTAAVIGLAGASLSAGLAGCKQGE